MARDQRRQTGTRRRRGYEVVKGEAGRGRRLRPVAVSEVVGSGLAQVDARRLAGGEQHVAVAVGLAKVEVRGHGEL